MADRTDLVWLFFRFTGRVNRAAYALGFLFMLMVVSFPLYQFMRVPEQSAAGQFWSLIFLFVTIAGLWSHVAFSVKRFHDIGKPGVFAVALFIPVVSIIAFIALCVWPGELGPNRYGRRANAPD